MMAVKDREKKKRRWYVTVRNAVEHGVCITYGLDKLRRSRYRWKWDPFERYSTSVPWRKWCVQNWVLTVKEASPITAVQGKKREPNCSSRSHTFQSACPFDRLLVLSVNLKVNCPYWVGDSHQVCLFSKMNQNLDISLYFRYILVFGI